MLRIARSTGRQLRVPTQVRHNHHVAYGPAEPIGPYVKWTAAVLFGVGLVTYDRYYSDGAITKLFTPASNAKDNAAEIDHFLDFERRSIDRQVTLFHSADRHVSTENFRVNPVPSGPARSEGTSDVLDLAGLGERRPRTKAN